jgi:hypothetical protein
MIKELCNSLARGPWPLLVKPACPGGNGPFWWFLAASFNYAHGHGYRSVSRAAGRAYHRRYGAISPHLIPGFDLAAQTIARPLVGSFATEAFWPTFSIGCSSPLRIISVRPCCGFAEINFTTEAEFQPVVKRLRLGLQCRPWFPGTA